ncbi:ABC transporter ATP-binding protein [Yinghuangia soli]|uniref:Spermidine/putrescine import ATP-binding protein PotA n=1 Tax=Yinghuangia soli TaxID=2908204 RepID=A0AA41Q7T0_9ACTN|nr:ABC transporter ATP-binding protein [Yinghuangia soli]MCF2532781.1 ABC transporter ATP-binding protein [Yinghuangia soli]
MSKQGRDAGRVELTGLSKRFGGFTAVRPTDLTIPEGSFFALLGASGCGKTTTLRMIAGLEAPSTGRVLIGGQDVTGLPPHKRPVNTVFQSYALFPHLSVADNVAFGLRRKGRKDVAQPVKEMLELVELGHLGGRKPAQLSGGQQQRVAVARALINHPQVLLLDEPLGALDLKLRRQMQLELKRIQTEVGITFVHVTHDQEEAMTMADTIAVMNGGVIEQLGSPTELYESPKTAFVANFLGQSNMLPAAVLGRQGDDLALDVHGVRMTLPASRAVPGSSGSSRIVMGIRPEKITLGKAEPDDAHRNMLRGIVSEASFIGVSTEYRVRIAEGSELVVFSQNRDDERPRVGDEVVLHWNPRHGFGLDAGQDLDAGTGEDAL